MPTASTETHWKAFGQWIKQQRMDARLTQAQVAKRAEITDVQLARIEKGESGTKRETAIKIAEAIGIDIKEVLNKAGYDVPKSVSIKDDLEIMDFDGLDPDDIRDIKEFIKFVKSRKFKKPDKEGYKF